MINIKNKENCTGCYSCENICPVDAINMEIDEEGFWYPKVQEHRCIDCKLCEKSCPIINKKTSISLKEAYGCFNKDDYIRLKSSSGGIFTAIAKVILQDNGDVFGAAFDENFQVKHICIENDDDLYKLRGSKYVQSNINTTYKQAKDILLQGRKVLFSGTPCQISGLKSFLGKEYDNLLCVDLICHGVPSPLVWKEYLKEISNSRKLSLITFRDKSNGWKNAELVYKFESGSEYREKYSESTYIKGFIQNCFLRPSCYTCHNKTLDRCSDLTLGDFWGVEEQLPSIDIQEGISLLLVHSEKGSSILNKIKNNIFVEKVDINLALTFNECAIQSVKLTKKRLKFFQYIKKLSVKESIEGSIKVSKLDYMIKKINFKINRLFYINKKVFNKIGGIK